MPEVYVGIGSNIEPLPHLREAIESLQSQFGALRLSCVYRSPAYGFVGDDFLNMVAGFATDLSPAAVEDYLYSVEYSGGRVRAPSRYSSRTLDLDLLLYGGLVRAALKLPRLDVNRYAFVTAPLAEIAPLYTHPVTGRSIEAIWQQQSAASPQIENLGPLAGLAG